MVPGSENKSILKGGGFFMKSNQVNSDNPLPGRSCGQNMKKPYKEKCYGNEEPTGGAA